MNFCDTIFPVFLDLISRLTSTLSSLIFLIPKTETSYFEELIPETSRIFSGEGSLTNSSTVCSFLYFSGTVSFTFRYIVISSATLWDNL
ncbi:hypothetical protein LQ356_00255 [Metamycoplasma faucium]|uniref:Uncharacterized protein n=1 Tax=Metamycoplasma faucium TaxID=56142 RepID=A0ABZ2TQV5_9BACT